MAVDIKKLKSMIYKARLVDDDNPTQTVLRIINEWWLGEAHKVERPHGEWKKFTLEGGFLSSHKCSNCGFCGNQLWHFCPNCGALMSANDRQVTGKLNEPKDSHSEYWNSIGEWKEGETE